MTMFDSRRVASPTPFAPSNTGASATRPGSRTSWQVRTWPARRWRSPVIEIRSGASLDRHLADVEPFGEPRLGIALDRSEPHQRFKGLCSEPRPFRLRREVTEKQL